MIIGDSDAAARLNSPLNLINRLRQPHGNAKNAAMGLFGLDRSSNGQISRVPLPASFSPTINIESELVVAQDAEIITEQPVKSLFNPFEKSAAPISDRQSGELVLAANTPAIIPQTPPTLDNLLNNSESQIKLGLAHDSALDVLAKSVELLSSKLDDVKADKLPGVMIAASKVVESIRKERLETAKITKEKEVHYHFYTPTQKKMTDYEVIEVQ